MLVVSEIVKRFPVGSVQQIPGFFDANTVVVAGEQLTLNGLAKLKIREAFRDPRTYFTLVCGAVGCPKLRRTAYEGNSLEAQLIIQARQVLQDEAFVRLNASRRRVELPELFQWYGADFQASGESGVAYVNQFRDGKAVPPDFAVSYYPHDWALNARK